MLCIDFFFLGAIKNSLKKQKGNRVASLSLPGVALKRKKAIGDMQLAIHLAPQVPNPQAF